MSKEIEDLLRTSCNNGLVYRRGNLHSMMGVSCKLSLKIWASHAPLLSQYMSSTLKSWATRLSHGLMVFKMPWYSVMSSNEKNNILGYIGDLGVSLGPSYSSRIAWTPLFIQPVAFTPHGGDYMEVIIPCVNILKILPK